MYKKNYFTEFLLNSKTQSGAVIIVLILLSALFSYPLLFHDQFATGFDGYYYVLQAASLRKTGHLLMPDNSLAISVFALFHFFINDPVSAIKTANLIFSSIAVIPVYYILKEIKLHKTTAIFSSLLFIISFSRNYISIEYLKNNLAVPLFLFCILFMIKAEKNRIHFIYSIIFLLLALFTHKLMGTLCFLFLSFNLLLKFLYSQKLTYYRKITAVLTLIIISITAFLMIKIIPLGLLRHADILHLLQNFVPNNLPDKITNLTKLDIANYEKTEYLLFHLIPIFFLFYLIIKKAFENTFYVSIFIISLITINPFMKFDVVSISYRLMIISFIPCIILVAVMINELVNYKRIKFIFPLIVILIIYLYNPLRQSKTLHSERYPNYSIYYDSFKKIKYFIPSDSRIIAHKGISSFIWYITGIEATHFRPTDNIDQYYRITYGFCPLHFEDFLDDTGFKPVELKWPYMIVSESMWQIFREKNKSFLTDSEFNPSKTRPKHVYAKQ